jgi:mono/diheme cytochrome c family protein
MEAAPRPFAIAFFLLTMTAETLLPDELPASRNDGVEPFEARVRPVLVENCFTCHGEKKQKGGLRLDSLGSLLKGSDSGPVLIAGEPEKSVLIHAIRQDGEVKMPPKGKLPEEAIEAITTWVKMGAPWPKERGPEAKGAETVPQAVTLEPKTSHWAFQPIRDPPLPEVQNEAWITSPIDRFILARLEEKGMAPSGKADKRALLRRATFDLIGLPPTQGEVDAYLNDGAPDDFAKVVERLLASPHYGERWGRYWLDVARYADTKGYVFEEERRFPYSYTYRDYVIRAFNEDLPYDRFLIEQIAADLLPKSDDKRPLAAMGFLTLGRRFLNNLPDIIDDRIDVMSRGILGLTVTCARCHDHKFDPIPTADYYSLYGVLASASEPREPPLVGVAEDSAAFQAFQKELEKREADVTRFIESKRSELLAEFRKKTPEYLVRVAEHIESRKPLKDEVPKGGLVAGELHPLLLRRWQSYLSEAGKAQDPIRQAIFGPWTLFSTLSLEEFSAKSPLLASQIAANADHEKPIHPLVVKAFAGDPPKSLKEVAERYGALFASAEKETDPAYDELRKALSSDGSPPSIPLAEIERFFDRAVKGKIRELRKKADEWKVTSPGAPPRAMSLEESASPHQPVIFVRGNPGNPGKEVPRQFLAVLSNKNRQPFQNGSGRLELAQAIASRENPLTARVLANRVWLHHFGAGLVRTPGDFGARSDAPTHPELLDYLASRLMESGWSIKSLHRLIMLSSVYQEASDIQPDYEKTDPDNRLLWRRGRRRLDFEALRDSLLYVSGRLDTKAGGPSVQLTAQPFSTRRTIYGFIDRQNLPGLFRTFDFASPDTTSPQRHSTTVPQQALFLMNSPFVVEQARSLASRPEVASKADVKEKVQALYQLAYGRPADEDEVAIGGKFLAKEEDKSKSSLSALEKYAQVILLSNEFSFVD